MSRAPLIEGVRDLTEIGRGGFGVVYRGTEVEFGRDVAVKVLMQLQDERAKRRFDRERRAMGAVSDHENIVTVYRGGVTPDNQPYLVMEYVRGGSLSDRLSTVGPLDWRQAAAVGAKLADALSVAHRAGILHRDVKPGNVFMTEHGEPKLGDFGIAVLDDGLASRTAGITASVAHAPPEIVDGQRGDERSDLYSLASTIYALTNGAAPFSRASDDGLAAVLSRIAKEAPRPLHLESAASHFEQSVLKALNKRPEDRHATLVEFGNELRVAALTTAEVPTPAVPESAPPVEPARPPGFAPQGPHTPLATHASSSDVSIPVTPSSNSLGRQISTGQLGFFALLLLAIAVFGGWAVANAVFEGDTGSATNITTATSQPLATSVAPTVAPAATPLPTTAPTPVPTTAPTPVATPAPSPVPTPGLGSRGGSTPVPETDGDDTIQGSGTAPEGFRRIGEINGAIQVNVPIAWAGEVYDISNTPSAEPPFAASALAIGGTVGADGASVDLLTRAAPGIFIIAERTEGVVDPAVLIDLALEDPAYEDCLIGLRREFPLFDGVAQAQLLECDFNDGDALAGLTILGLVPENRPDVGVTISLQLTGRHDDPETETMIEQGIGVVLPSIRINPERLPDPADFDSDG